MQSALASLDTPATCSLDEIAREQNRTLPAQLYRHLENWQKVRRGESAPSLSDLFNESDPVTQPWLVVIDTEHEDKQPIRLIGTAVADFFGFDATGYDFLQSVAPPLRGIFIDAHRTIAHGLVGKFHLAICSTSTGRELEVLAFALPYKRKNDLPCAAWLLIPGADRRYGETGSEVRTIVEQRWVCLSSVA